MEIFLASRIVEKKTNIKENEAEEAELAVTFVS